MTTTTYTLPSFRVASTDIPRVNALEFSTLSFTFDQSVTTVRTVVDPRVPDGTFVFFDPDPIAVSVGGEDITASLASGDILGFTALTRLDGPNFGSVVAVYFQFSGETEADASAAFDIVAVSGDPLPDFEYASDIRLFLDDPDIVDSPTDLGRGAPIVLADIPGIVLSPLGAGDDLRTGGLRGERFDGFGGDDTLRGGGGDDSLFGGAGDDRLEGGADGDLLVGGDGGDALFGGAGADLLRGDAGADALRGGDGADTLRGGAEDDDMRGDAGDDLMLGDAGADTLRGGTGDDELRGGAGADVLLGDAGDDRLSGGSEDDVLSGGAGADTLEGGAGADTLDGGAGGDTYLVDGADILRDSGGDDAADVVLTARDYRLAADGGIERVEAVGGDAVRLDGTAGDETLVGNDADNLLVGAGGADTLTGQGGADTFVLTAGAAAVVITDFEAGVDRLAIDDRLLGIGAAGVDPRDLTAEVLAELRADGVVGYDARSGTLRIDVDGDGAREVVARLDGGAVLGLDDVLLF